MQGLAQEFLDALVEAGQRAEYIQGRRSGSRVLRLEPDENPKATFAKHGVYYAATMKAFFESVLYERVRSGSA